MATTENDNFEDHIRDPKTFAMTDRYGSEEEKSARIVFPDDPILLLGSKPAVEGRIDERIVFPNDRSKPKQQKVME